MDKNFEFNIPKTKKFSFNDIKWKNIESFASYLRTAMYCNSLRNVNSNGINEYSTRGHMVQIFKRTIRNESNYFYLFDLCGIERSLNKKFDKKLTDERSFINSTLLELTQC